MHIELRIDLDELVDSERGQQGRGGGPHRAGQGVGASGQAVGNAGGQRAEEGTPTDPHYRVQPVEYRAEVPVDEGTAQVSG